MPFVAAYFNELVSSSTLNPTLMSFCTQDLPGVAESTVCKKRSKTFSLEGEGARRADEGKGKPTRKPSNPPWTSSFNLLEYHDH